MANSNLQDSSKFTLPLNNSALWFRQFGDPLQALTFEVAELKTRPPSQIRVRMSAAPINPSDIIPVTGAYRHTVTPPRVAGYEGMGTVIEADEEAAKLIGRRVLPLRGPGTWQTYVDCDPVWAVPVPDDVDDNLAARSYINPLAAYLMLKRWPVRGKRVLLTGAGSTCAALLAQWAYNAGALEVVGIYRSRKHIVSLIQLGLKPINIASVTEISAALVKTDIAFDAVGGGIGTSILAGLSPRADFVSYGLLSGEPFQATSNGVQAQRFHLRDCLETTTPAEWQQWFCELWPLLKRTVLPGVAPFPLGAWREALSLFNIPGRSSKPILIMGSTGP